MAKETPMELKTYDIGKPAEVVKMATVLKDYVVRHKLYTNIQSRNYVQVEGWQFAGFLLGLTARIEEVERIEGAELKWKAEVGIYRGDQKVSSGYAVCSNKEPKRRQADEYVILSMAQTRAIGKAYRNLIGWAMKLAGYESTPSEDMPDEPKSKEPVIDYDKAPFESPVPDASAEAVKKLRAQRTLAGLHQAWKGLTAKQRADKKVEAAKNEVKKSLE